MRIEWLMIGGFLAASLGAPRLARAGCQADNECKGDRICVEGRCVDVPTCAKDGDCPGKLVCEQARCVSARALAAPPAPAPPAAAPPAAAPPPAAPRGAAPYAPAAPPPSALPSSTPFYTQQTLPEVRYRSPGMRRAGIGLFVTGMILDVVGSALIGTAYAVGCGYSYYSSDCSTENTLVLSGAAMAGIGGVMWITGIPLWVVGGSRVSGAASPEASLKPGLTVGGLRLTPAGRGLAVNF
jgi:hypothetical protein